MKPIQYKISVYNETISCPEDEEEIDEDNSEVETLVEDEIMDLEGLISTAQDHGVTMTSSSDGSGSISSESYIDYRTGDSSSTSFHYEILYKGKELRSQKYERLINRMITG